MNLFELFVKIGVDDQATGKIKKVGDVAEKTAKGGLSTFASKIGSGLATAAKIGTAAVGAAAAGITALTTAAVNNYAEYEQLIGGVETLYGAKYKTIEEYIEGTGAAAETAAQTFAEYQNRQQEVLDNAASAYRTAGMSANEYMNTVNGFAASLTNSLGEYEWQAASYADMIVSDMADNANKMGTSMDMIQNAYAGFAKQNYTMLDNLKLGYGGTKTEMERLLRDAERTAGYIEGSLDIESFADIADAIHIVQEEMGITGTTALEAGRTIAGSVQSMKSAWTNLVTGFADGSADIGGLIDNLVTTIVGDGTESNLGVIGNVLPAVETALGGIVKLIEGAAPKIIEILPGLIERIIPSLLSSTASLVNSLVSVLPKLLSVIVGEIVKNAPSMVIAAISLIKELAKGIFDNVGIVLDAAIKLVLDLANQLTDKEQLEKMLDSAARIVEEVSYGLIDAIPELVSSAVKIIENLVSFILDPKNLSKILKMAFDIVVGIGTGLINAIPELLKSVTRIISGIIAMFKDADWGKIGSDLVAGFKNGISRAWSSLKTWFRNLFGDLIGIAKRILGIASPSKVFKKLGSFTADGFGIGFDDEFAHVKDNMEDALNFDDASVGINASIRKVGAGVAGGSFGGTSIGNITINVDGAKYSDEQSLASAIALEIQNMTDRRAAVYA